VAQQGETALVASRLAAHHWRLTEFRFSNRAVVKFSSPQRGPPVPQSASFPYRSNAKTHC
jgi:hypothetical protein